MSALLIYFFIIINSVQAHHAQLSIKAIVVFPILGRADELRKGNIMKNI